MSEQAEIVQEEVSVNEMEAWMVNKFPVRDSPVRHIFTPGLYTRQILMTAGTFISSRVHKSEHPYFISMGKALVWTEEGMVLLEAPHTGITKPGTHRFLLILQDCIWTTVHANPDNETVGEIEKRIIEPFDNPEIKKVLLKQAMDYIEQNLSL